MGNLFNLLYQSSYSKFRNKVPDFLYYEMFDMLRKFLMIAIPVFTSSTYFGSSETYLARAESMQVNNLLVSSLTAIRTHSTV